MLKQLLICLVILVLAVAGYILFVPGSAEALSRIGIPVPQAPAVTATSGAPPGSRPAGGQFAGRGGGSRALVVVTAPVGTARINDRLNAIGVGAAARSVAITAPSAGTLEALLVSPGATVSAGDTIARLDSESETIAFQRAELSAKDAAETLRRTTELAKSNAATTVQLNTAQLAVDNAQLEVQAAELALRRRSIATPIAGTVGLFQVTPGNFVSAQAPVTTIEDNSGILISFWVPERYASAIALGMPVEAEAVALPGRLFTGTVTAVDNRVDATSRTLQVEARIANEGNAIRAGMSFSVAMQFDGQDFPNVDPLSIQWSSAGAYVWKYADGKVDRAQVRIIQRNSDGVLVEGDLKEGDAVVTQGVQQLSAGASVRLLDAPEDTVRPARGEGTRPAAPQAAPQG